MGRRAESVKVDSGPVEATDPLRYVPVERWRDLMLARRQFLEVKVSHDCRCLVEFVTDAEQMFRPLGFKSPEAMIRDGYGLEPEEVEIAVRWLELNHPEEPVGLPDALLRAKRGRPKKEEEKASRANVYYGDNEAYWTAVLARDRPDVRVDEGKAIATATKLGIRKPRKRISRFDQIVKWWPTLTEEQKDEIRGLP